MSPKGKTLARLGPQDTGKATGQPRGKTSGNIVFLDLASRLNDIGSEIIQPILPISTAPGWMAVGRWADRLGRRKPLVEDIYGFSAVAKVILATSMYLCL